MVNLSNEKYPEKSHFPLLLGQQRFEVHSYISGGSGKVIGLSALNGSPTNLLLICLLLISNH